MHLEESSRSMHLEESSIVSAEESGNIPWQEHHSVTEDSQEGSFNQLLDESLGLSVRSDPFDEVEHHHQQEDINFNNQSFASSHDIDESNNMVQEDTLIEKESLQQDIVKYYNNMVEQSESEMEEESRDVPEESKHLFGTSSGGAYTKSNVNDFKQPFPSQFQQPSPKSTSLPILYGGSATVSRPRSTTNPQQQGQQGGQDTNDQKQVVEAGGQSLQSQEAQLEMEKTKEKFQKPQAVIQDLKSKKKRSPPEEEKKEIVKSWTALSELYQMNGKNVEEGSSESSDVSGSDSTHS